MLRDGKGPFFSIQKELLEPQSPRDGGVQASLPDGLAPPGAKPQDRSRSRPQTPACCLGAAGKAAVRCLKDLCVAACTHRLPGTAPRPGVRARVVSVASARASCSYRDVTGGRLWSPAGRPAEGPVAQGPAPPRRRPQRYPVRNLRGRARPRGFGWAGAPPSAPCDRCVLQAGRAPPDPESVHCIRTGRAALGS